VECASGASLSYQDLRRRWTENDASTVSGPLWVTQSLNMLLVSGVSDFVLAFVLEADILSTWCNKGDVMWQLWLFGDNCQSCLSLFVCCYIMVWIHCCKRQNYDFCISQGSVATYFRCGEMFTYQYVANFLLCLTVKEFLQLVKSWQS